MHADSLTYIFLNAAIINNFVLALFLGICPLLGVSGKISTAFSMGLATAFVMLISSVSAWLINEFLLYFNLEFLRLIAYIAVIASAVQLVEMTIKKFSPPLYRALGIFLPLITTNCAILGVALFQTNYEYSFSQSLVYSLGAGAGFIIAIVLMAGLREKLELADVPAIARGAAMSLMLAGILSLAFMGFAGLGGSTA
ncbi:MULTISPECIES: electron transport complex protein RnfA [Ectothiorhodospira]|uniref:Ion-translocating oxidoreductase complex subunit A n=1 Tax=Ectothiorhodospira magna TaxID=867345 RepID=A0A1H9BRX6_9GAMM|nr:MULTISPECIES: RnfABCDGE type electron transport complex subunit A [Ectothiorhodospira]EHQ52815.1 RnfA-Nqr electron transport subunit [Ectothiorhodospira sp. PHS-1]MCG5501158.1 RnfABCDGE type electron transport complex subunit A [Ectothiorhodospira lacustris]MCG5509536.1 RnfABCDGE type electron transport complex subunit A [Ectothiorhodospira lacustris]MCG5521669.1 RnfABCDGE type electron transport complex subunit A [Ectothiorhodospira lacustris]SEP91734.1 electron transport complex protein R